MLTVVLPDNYLRSATLYRLRGAAATTHVSLIVAQWEEETIYSTNVN